MEAGNLKNQLEQSAAAQEKLQNTVEQQQGETLALKTAAATLEARLEDSSGKVARLEAELAKLREAQQADSVKVATLTSERDSAKSRVRELAQECGELKQENKGLLADVKKK